MNFYDLYADALEKVALSFDELPRDIRSHIAHSYATDSINTYGALSEHHRRSRDLATKKNKTSVKKSERPGILSSIRHLGPERARTHHKGRAKSTAEDIKYHNREFGKADKDANEHFDAFKRLLKSQDKPKEHDRIISDYNKKHMKAKVSRRSGF